MFTYFHRRLLQSGCHNNLIEEADLGPKHLLKISGTSELSCRYLEHSQIFLKISCYPALSAAVLRYLKVLEHSRSATVSGGPGVS